MVEIKAKLTRIGNSYAFIVPKPLIDCKVLPLGKKLTLKVEEDTSVTMGFMCSAPVEALA